MAYVAPSGNAIDFTLSDAAYAIPLGNAVAFEFVNAVPTVTFSSATTLDIRGAVFVAGATSIASIATTAFENPYRAFQIDGRTDPTFVTWQRRAEISSGSVAAFRPGARINFASSTTVSPQVWATLQSSSTISGGNSVQFSAMWIHNATCSVVGAGTKLWARSGYIKPLSFVIKAGVEFRPRHASGAAALFNSDGRTSVALSHHTIIRSSSDVSAAASLAYVGSAKCVRDVSLVTSCAAEFYGQLGGLGTVEMPTRSTVGFVGAASQQDLHDEPEMLIYQTARQSQIYVRTISA